MLCNSHIVNSGSLIKLIGGPVGIILDHIIDEVSTLMGNLDPVVYVALVNGSSYRLIRESFEVLNAPTT